MSPTWGLRAQLPHAVAGAALDVSHRHLVSRAATIGLVMRHTANLLVAVVVLTDPHSGAHLAGRVLCGALGLWAIYRLLTRSGAARPTILDVAFTVAVCLAIPSLVADPGFYLSNSAPIAVAGTAVIGFTVGLPIRFSVIVTVLIAVSYAAGAAAVIGWAQIPNVFNLYYFGLQWGTCALIRLAELRVATAVDATRAQRQHADLTQRVSEAVRDYDREQLSLLHDTVASTLLLVGQGSPLPSNELAAQARRDLDLLAEPKPAAPGPLDVVEALHHLGPHHRTPIRVIGAQSLWVDSAIGHCVVSATREALNNVDRHAHASTVTLTVEPNRIVIIDDGTGFDPAHTTHGYGISHSMTARMGTLGGDAAVVSTPGEGTAVTLTWPTPADREAVATFDAAKDPDRLIERTRTGYALALTAYAVLSLASMIPPALPATAHPGSQIVLASVAAVITLTAVPYTLGKRTSPALRPALLLVIALLQTALLPAAALGGQAQWSQAAIGWCVLPFLLHGTVRRGAAWLISVWGISAAYTFLRAPAAHTAVNVGLGTASILSVQLFALLFSGLVTDAAADAHAEFTALTALVAKQRITTALQMEYRRRYASIVDNVRPLLQAWCARTPVDHAMRRRANVESRRLRTLFNQSTVFEHPLLIQLRCAVDSADARGAEVSIDVQGALPPMTESDARHIAAPLTQALTVASTARVTVLVVHDVVTAAAVCHDVDDADVSALGAIVGDDVTVIVGADATVWVTVRHQLQDRRPATP